MFELQAPLPDLSDMVEKDGLRLFSLESALIEASPRYFLHHATDARAAMAMIRDASDLLARLLDGGHSTIAGRLAGAFRNSGRGALADEITRTMSAAGYALRETDPFTDRPAVALSFR
ncbi:MAG: cell filamentation protein Fic, partial [Acidobacteria bacterium]